MIGRRAVQELQRHCVRAASTSTSSSSSSSSSTWQPPLKRGESRAYDAAVDYIKKDSEYKLGQLEKRKREGAPDEELERLSIEAWINDPETRWRARKGMGNLDEPVDRHLAEKEWRQGGRASVLMQRVEQMKVVPDLLASIDPVAELKLAIQQSTLEPGAYSNPSQTLSPPTVTAQVFHTDERLYTVLLIDPDVPDDARSSFTTYVHSLRTNVPLSATKPLDVSTSGDEVLPYIPPHPQQGTKYHRYTYILFAQPPNEDKVSIEAAEREGFDTRAFMSEHGLAPEGVTFFRQVWDESVSDIYRDTLKTEEPHYKPANEVDVLDGFR